jgi:peptidoglycan/LPS O-acetylase OafA/YrhL
MGTAVLSATQDAADMARQTAERAAARLPEAVAGVQVAATETQRVLDEMPSQALLIGTSFSLGLGVGLFVSGANRFLVALALAPAGAMALTMFGREQQSTGASAANVPIGNRRASRSTAGTGGE